MKKKRLSPEEQRTELMVKMAAGDFHKMLEFDEADVPTRTTADTSESTTEDKVEQVKNDTETDLP